MKRLLLISLAAGSLCGAHALAADMPVKEALPVPAAPATGPDWSGLYFGGDLGWQGSGIGLSSPAGGASLTYAPQHDSFALGAFVGAQRQFGQFVVGVEGGYMAGFGDASLGATPSISIFYPGGTGTAQASLKNIWSIGGRVGWAAGQWMPYLTGGYANGSFEFDAQDSFQTERASASLNGGYIGAGVDWALARNWTVGAEYRHYAFSATTVTSTQSNLVTFAPSTDTVMARVSYIFDWQH